MVEVVVHLVVGDCDGRMSTGRKARGTTGGLVAGATVRTVITVHVLLHAADRAHGAIVLRTPYARSETKCGKPWGAKHNSTPGTW